MAGTADGTKRGPRARRWRLVRARGPAGAGPRWRWPRPGAAGRAQGTGRMRRLARRPVMLWSAAALLTVLALVWLVFGTSVLGVRVVEVTGSRIAGPDAVRAVAAVRMGTPLARVDVDAVQARVQALPSVARVTVRRSWPSTLRIEVQERQATAVVATGARFLVLDAGGVVFDTVAVRPRGVALVRLATPGPDDPSTRAAMRVLAALSPSLRGQLVELVVTSPDQIRLDVAGARTVIWGDAEQSDTKSTVATSLLARPGRVIDVSAPEVVTVS
jgi:cell division protein FtsQ